MESWFFSAEIGLSDVAAEMGEEGDEHADRDDVEAIFWPVIGWVFYDFKDRIHFLAGFGTLWSVVGLKEGEAFVAHGLVHLDGDFGFMLIFDAGDFTDEASWFHGAWVELCGEVI